MDVMPGAPRRAVRLMDIIELKWLLARDGVHLHVERLQDDRDYARACLGAAGRSPRRAVREAAARIARMLDLTPDVA